ncbi:MAG: DUF3501 family protein [Myxococcota bacterium]
MSAPSGLASNDPRAVTRSFVSRSASPNAIRPEDILELPVYRRVRSDYRNLITELKRFRRARLAPHVGLLFENRETVLHQIHEVLLLEGHTPARVRSELQQYACLLPPPGELRATAMVDGGGPALGRRLVAALRRPGAVRLTVGALTCGSELAADDDTDDEDAVQYLRFRPSIALRQSLHAISCAELSFEVEGRSFITAVSDGLRDQLAQDLDAAPVASLLTTLAACPVISPSSPRRMPWPF